MIDDLVNYIIRGQTSGWKPASTNLCVSIGDNCGDKETGGEATGYREQLSDVISTSKYHRLVEAADTAYILLVGVVEYLAQPATSLQKQGR